LSKDPVEAAQFQCNRHVVKMIVESAQMLSTAHRILDGIQKKGPSKSGKTVTKKWIHPDVNLDTLLYKTVHVNHPCTVWTMKSKDNYLWHWNHFIALCEEYTHRYENVHKTDSLLRDILSSPPKKIPDLGLTQFPLAMKSNPECMFPDDPVKSYRMFYQTKQKRFKMVWTKREIPDWFKIYNTEV
jgi:hypothetical protein